MLTRNTSPTAWSRVTSVTSVCVFIMGLGVRGCWGVISHVDARPSDSASSLAFVRGGAMTLEAQLLGKDLAGICCRP